MQLMKDRHFRILPLVLLAGVTLLLLQPAQAKVTTAQGVTAARQLLELEDVEPRFCGTALAVAAAEALQGADPLVSRLLASALQRPSQEHELVSPSGHFRVHFDTSGRDAVDDVDEDDNGIPDYVDRTMAIADSSWELQINVLGYRTPPSDGGAGGGDEVDIYIVDLGRRQNYGITYPMTSGATGPSYLEVDNNFTDAIFGNTFICPGFSGTREEDALRVTLAHEFFHVIQFGYYQGSDGSWWQEASATWMEDVAYPDLNDYLQYVCSFLLVPGRAIDSGIPSADFHSYGAAVFAHFLDQRFGRDVIRWIWDEHSSRRSARLDNFDSALRNYSGTVLGVENVSDSGIEAAYSEMGVWSWFVGDRFREGFFAEGDRYPSEFVDSFPVTAKVAVSDSGRLDHMSRVYIRLEPSLLPGGGVIDTELARGRWRRHLLLVSADSVEVRSLGDTGGISLAGWDAWEDVILVISNVDVIGIGYDYEVIVTYDPELVDGPAPGALVLETGVPNPFRPGLHGVTFITFELDRASVQTQLTLFAADGALVRQFNLGSRSARRHSVRWDGTNQDGAFVASGIYYAVLQADGVERRKPLAVIRDR
ncbi:MAG: hypothetical protein O2782_10170 [bacterium]|nr:hypothetical protein [bacterium]